MRSIPCWFGIVCVFFFPFVAMEFAVLLYSGPFIASVQEGVGGVVVPHASSFPCLGRDGTTGDGHRIHPFAPPSHPLRFYYLFDRWMGRQDPRLLLP